MNHEGLDTARLDNHQEALDSLVRDSSHSEQ